MNKLNLQTPDGATKNIEKIEGLFSKCAESFPNCVVESEDAKGNVVKKIDFDLLRAELGDESVTEGLDERYRLDWPGKKRSILKANTPITKTLRPVKEDSVDWDNTQNLYIEGDNFEVLKILQESYLNKIKMIYIDPPYNTGNDFVYNDNFDESTGEYKNKAEKNDDGLILVKNTETEGRFHSNWLSMMYERLRIARDLLSNNGTIFISIDENEVTNLRKICNEIFGESAFIGQFNWMKTATPPSLSKNIRRKFEFILCYGKSSECNGLNGGIVEGGDMPLLNEINAEGTLKFDKEAVFFKIADGNYKAGEKDRVILNNDINIVNGKSTTNFSLTGHFKRSQTTLDEEIKQGTKFWIKSEKFAIRYAREGERIKVPSNIISKDECGVGTNEDGQKDIEKLFGKKVMDYPKPVSLMTYILRMNSSDNDIVLDFFSGSATTAHACLQLNTEDGCKRNFIMVQLPELINEQSEAYKAGYKNICDLGKERIRRASKKIKEETGADIDYGFRVYKVDDSCMKDVYYHPSEIKQDNIGLFESNIKEDRTPEDLLTQVILASGLTLDLPIEEKKIGNNTVFYVAGNSLVACFDEKIDMNIIDEIAKDHPLKVVFRDSGFSSDADRINVETNMKKLSPDTSVRVI